MTSVDPVYVERKRFSILVKDPDARSGTLYVRGSDDSMRKLINFEDSSDNYNSIINFNHQRGLKSVVYASKTVSSEEAEKFFNEYIIACKSTIDQEGKFTALATAMESNLKFEAIVGFKNKLQPDSSKTIELMRRMGVRVHILSGDNYEHCQMAAFSLNLFESAEHVMNFDFQNVEAGRTQLKRALEMISARMKDNGAAVKVTRSGNTPQAQPVRQDSITSRFDRTSSMIGTQLNNTKDLELSISGSAVAVAMQDEYLKSHLMMIFEYSKSVVGYALSPQHKADIVNLFKSLEHRTMAVGDGFNDINMLQTAHVGIQFYNKMMGSKFGDILVDNLMVIPTVMCQHARRWNHNMHMLVHNTFKYSLLLLLVNVLYQFFCGSTGVKVVSTGLTTLSLFFTVPVSVIFVFCSRDYILSDPLRLPALYCEKNYLSKLIHLRVFLFHMLPEVLVEVILVFLLPLFMLRGALASDGTMRGLGDLQTIVWLLSFLPFTYRMIICSSEGSWTVRVTCLLTWTFKIALIILLSEIDILTRIDRLSFYYYFSPNNTLLLIIMAMFLYTLNVGYWSAFGFPNYFPILDFISRSLKRKSQWTKYLLSPDCSEDFLQKFKCSDNFTTSFKKCFESRTEVNPILSALLSPEAGAAEENISKQLLQFNSMILNKKYMIFVADKLSTIMKVLVGVGSTAVALYLLLEMTIDLRHLDQLAWVYFFLALMCIVTFGSTSLMIWAKKVNTYNQLFHLSLLLGSVLFCIARNTDYSLLGCLVMLFTAASFHIEYTVLLVHAALNVSGFVLTLASNHRTIEEKTWRGIGLGYSTALMGSVYLACIVATVLMRRKIESLLKREFVTGTRLDKTSEMASDLLSLLLPKFVLDKMQNFFEISEKSAVFQNDADVTILFCDIADFDEVVRRNESNIVSLLDRIFRKFDDLCILHGIQKIETVGKTYMAAGGIDAVENGLSLDFKKLSPTLRTLNLAKDMMDHIKEYEGLNLKIGIHVGKPVIGVIGYHKPQFSLIGDVVNTTSRHCTTGKVGRIMMSEAAWEVVKSSSVFSQGYSHELIPTDMKGKGSVTVHHLFPKKNKFIGILRIIMGKNDNELKGLEAIRQKKVISNLISKVSTLKSGKEGTGGRFALLVRELAPTNFDVFHQIRTNLDVKHIPKAILTEQKTEDESRLKVDTIVPKERGSLIHKVDITEADEDQGEVEVDSSLQTEPNLNPQ